MPLWLAEKANLRKISYQSGIHKEPSFFAANEREPTQIGCKRLTIIEGFQSHCIYFLPFAANSSVKILYA